MVSSVAHSSSPQTVSGSETAPAQNGDPDVGIRSAAKRAKVKPKTANAVVPRRKPIQPLPTDRIQFENQTKLIRAYAVAAGPEGRGVTNAVVARIVTMHPDTVALSNAFFTGVGLIQRTDSGFVPAPEVIAFNRAFEWNPETAGFKLAPVMERAWFGQCLIPRLRVAGTMDEREAIEALASASDTPPQQKKQLELILDYMATAGLIQREGGVLRIMRQGQQPVPVTESQEAPPTQPENRNAPTKGSPLAAALFPSSADGMVQFHISVRVSMAEFKDWQADRLSAFFSGIAKVLSARGKEELPEM